MAETNSVGDFTFGGMRQRRSTNIDAMNGRVIAHALKGFGYAALIVATISITSGVVLSHDRFSFTLRQAFADKTLVADWKTDSWIDCALLEMEFTRESDALVNAVKTTWRRPIRHTCDDLQTMLSGPPFAYVLNDPSPYVNYPFGARHLNAIALSILSVAQTETLYRILSYASILVLLLGAWTNSRRFALDVVLPIALLLTFAFEQHRYAPSLAFSASFFTSFFALGIFLAMRNHFADPARRIAFFCFLGTMPAFFDIMNGSIPVVLSLSLVLNHFFYVKQRKYDSWKSYWLQSARQALCVSGVIVLAFVVLTVSRLLITSYFVPNAFARFDQGMNLRMGDEVAGVGAVHLVDVLQKLWYERDQMTGNPAATWLLIAATLSWCFAIGGFGVLWQRLREDALVPLGDVLVLGVASVVFAAWYVLLPNHTYIHAWMMVRMLALPAAYGFASAITSYKALRLPSDRGNLVARHAGRRAVRPSAP